MVTRQVIQRGITDSHIVEAMRRVPRHLFVDEGLRAQSYGEGALPIASGQSISQPYIVARMIQSLDLIGNEKVLEIGTGSGYQTAVLAEIAARVCSVERDPALARQARRLLHQLGYSNIRLLCGDGSVGFASEQPFDCIIVSACLRDEPRDLIVQLKDGGRLVAPMSREEGQVIVTYTRTGNASDVAELETCRFVRLIGPIGWPDESPGAK
jgi:protein-L-isoaspartate(D-aspartate) O-methyltransferase